MNIKMERVIKKFGVPLEIYSADKLTGDTNGGFETSKPISSIIPDIVKWPLVPYGTFGNQNQIRNTGSDMDYDYEMVGTKLYPVDSVVVDTRTKTKLWIKHVSDLQGYSDSIIYDLKASDKDDPII